MKLTQSLVAIAALSTLSFAGGDINPVTVFEQEPVVVPVEPPVVVKPPVVTAPPAVIPPAAKDWYVALGATALKAKQDADTTATPAVASSSDSQTGITARIGYDFMDWLGAELRGTSAVSGADTGSQKIKQIGAYLKPNVDLSDSLNLYGLLGGSKVNMATPNNLNEKESGFSYGLGLDYSVSDTVSVFVDVVDYLRKSNKNDVYGATLGAAYHF